MEVECELVKEDFFTSELKVEGEFMSKDHILNVLKWSESLYYMACTAAIKLQAKASLHQLTPRLEVDTK
jgi:hypothetical protein